LSRNSGIPGYLPQEGHVMLAQKPFDESRFIEKLALWFVWLVVIGSGLFGIGLLLLHELGPHS